MRLGNIFKQLSRQAASTRAAASIEPLDLQCDRFFASPYSTYAAARDLDGPIPCVPAGYAFSRHFDIVAALSNPNLGNAPSRYSTLNKKNNDKYIAATLANNILPFMDKPEHVQARKAVSTAFRSRLKDFKSEIFEIAQTKVMKFSTNRSGNLVGDFTQSYASEIMCRFLDVPVNDAAKLKRWATSFFFLFAPISNPGVFAKTNSEMYEFRTYWIKHLQFAKSGFAAELREIYGGKLPIEQLADTCILLFADGVENVEAGIANIMLQLSQNPGVLEDLIDGSVPIENVVREGLRIDTPGQIIPRIVRNNCNIAGTVLKADTPVFLLLGSANHDSSVFENPTTFNPGRDHTAALTFGAGRHSCIGAQLASLQIGTAVYLLAQAKARVTDHPMEVQYHHRFAHRWPKKLTVKFT